MRILLVPSSVILLVTFVAFFFSQPVHATTWCVNPDGSGGCYSSIQAAVDAASPGDRINIAAGTYAEGVNITKDNITLSGAGQSTTSMGWLGNHSSQISISGLSLRMLDNRGTVTLSNVIVTKSGTPTIYNSGTITLTNAAILDNIGQSRPLLPILINVGTANLINVTFSSNRSSGIAQTGTMTLRNVTFRDSYSFGYPWGTAPGIVTTITNSILASNVNCGYYQGTFISQGHNLSTDNTCPLSATGDVTNTDPLLTPLVTVSGTVVCALMPGSPAIDAGDDSICPPTDQTGFPRPYGAHCDIGAYEWRPMNFNFYFYFFPFVTR